MSRVIYVHRVLSRNLHYWLAAGWTDTGVRDRPPSLSEAVCVIEWHGESPPMVERRTRFPFDPKSDR